MSLEQTEPTTIASFADNTSYSRKPYQAKSLLKKRLNLLGRCVIDLILINGVFILAYTVRYSLQIGVEIVDTNVVPLGDYFWSQLGFVATFLIVLQFKGFYRASRNVTFLDELGIIGSATAYTVLTILAFVFLVRPTSVSRLMYVYLFPISFFVLGAERLIAWRIRRSLLLRGYGVKNVLILGATDQANRIMQGIIDTPYLGLKLIGYVDSVLRFSQWTLPVRFRNGDRVPHIGSIEELNSLVNSHNIEEIMVTLPANMHQTINDVIHLCRDKSITFTLVPDIFELQVNTLNFHELNGVPLIGAKDNRLIGWNYFIKRMVDISLSLGAILVAAIPMAIIAIAVKFDSPGSIILRQTRVGKHGKVFTFYKFRSMYSDADKRFEELLKYNQTGGATFKMTNDPRCTRVGRFIRKTSLDELPQLFNVLRGQMSFVGPRPGLERELKQYKEWHFRRLEVTPGLTGLSQVSGRSNLKFDDTARFDIYYAENWSIWLDLKILLRTIPAVLKREGAY